MRGAYGQLVLKPAKDLALSYDEVQIAERLARIETKLDHLFEDKVELKELSERVGKVEKKLYIFTGGGAVIGFLLSNVPSWLGLFPKV